MDLTEWGLYVNDEGRVSCNQSGCQDFEWTAATDMDARRVTVAELLWGLEDHIRRSHPIVKLAHPIAPDCVMIRTAEDRLHCHDPRCIRCFGAAASRCTELKCRVQHWARPA